MRFRHQLIVGHAALLFVTIATGIVAAIALHTTSDRLEGVARDLTTDMIAVHHLRFEAEQLVATSRGYLLTGNPKSLERFAGVSDRLDASLALLRHRVELSGDLARIKALAGDYVHAAEQAAQRRTSDPQTILPFFETTLAPARDRFEAEIDHFVHREQDAFELASQRSQRFAGRTQVIVILATALGVALSIFLAGISIRKLSARYAREREATAAAQRAAAARDDLLAIVSHDLRNPLATITMGMSLLDAATPVTWTRKHVAAISNAASHMRHLIDELLDVAKLESGTFEVRTEPCDVAALLDSTLALFDARAREARIAMSIETCPGVSVRAERERILQVLGNLASNALKFTRPDGRITLAAEAVGARVRFRVADTGCGIAEDQVPHLFERYWQGRARGRDGLGLGLYICKQVVDAHHGQIDVETRLGEGSTFSFTLPRA